MSAILLMTVSPFVTMAITAFTRLYFLDIAQHLFIKPIPGGNDHYRHFGIHQSNGAVLHFGGRIAFGMDIRNLLQLQGAFQATG